MNQDHRLNALLTEYRELKSEIADIHKHQFQLTTAVTLGLVAGFGAWVGFLRSYPHVLALMAMLALAQIALALDFRLRILGLSQRIQIIERSLRELIQTCDIMQWESNYVPRLFSAQMPRTGRCRKATHLFRRFCMRLLRGAFLIPLFLLYVICVYMFWMAPVPHPLYWSVVAACALGATLGISRVVAKEIDRQLKPLVDRGKAAGTGRSTNEASGRASTLNAAQAEPPTTVCVGRGEPE